MLADPLANLVNNDQVQLADLRRRPCALDQPVLEEDVELQRRADCLPLEEPGRLTGVGSWCQHCTHDRPEVSSS